MDPGMSHSINDLVVSFGRLIDDFGVSHDKSPEEFTGSDGVIDYAKMTEKKSVRRRRFFSLGVVSFTAFIFNLSFSIILTSAKPYLDKVKTRPLIVAYTLKVNHLLLILILMMTFE